MPEYTIYANVYRDGVLIGSAYGSGSDLAAAAHDVHSDLVNMADPEHLPQGQEKRS